MIIVRTPLRISIAGGGTDIPSWYREHGSMFISAAIDKYIYITFQTNPFSQKINLRYSQSEEVDTIDDIQHSIIRETLRLYPPIGGINITSHADIPAGTGLGSSGSFGVAMVHALNPDSFPRFLAKKSTEIQKDILQYPIGLQDQYVAAYGGMRFYEIDKEGETMISHKFSPVEADGLLDHLVLFFTGKKRDANVILAQSSDDGLQEVQNIAYKVQGALAGQNYDNYGHLLDEHWGVKKKRHLEMSDPQIDEWYELAKKNGALGGKLIGAGGGGFLLFYTNEKQKLIDAMPLTHHPFNWDYEGSKVIYNDER